MSNSDRRSQFTLGQQLEIVGTVVEVKNGKSVHVDRRMSLSGPVLLALSQTGQHLQATE